MQEVKIELVPGGRVPTFATPGANGADVYCRIPEEMTVKGPLKPEGYVQVKPGETKAIPVGFRVELPKGMAMLVIPRSGLSLKTGLEIANAPGLVDMDYRGEVAVIVRNIGNEDLWIKDGDRIAQVVFVSIDQVRFVEGNRRNIAVKAV